ncbi:hypothetical protein TcasGA2_TC003463 [Tribolium castaneum]|uniref:Uncharacterized protein n=1 Tax=Tribolium castaneum TaxID=7070 RepID=D6WGN3_TRICA|nr:hypothetical protein TcasGA2_TC003463 [Tribolium castaneum]
MIYRKSLKDRSERTKDQDPNPFGGTNIETTTKRCLPLHHAVKDKQEYRERGSTVHIIAAVRDEIANRMGRSWVPGATRARTAPYIIDWRLEGPPEPPRHHCLRTILYAALESASFAFHKFINRIFDFWKEARQVLLDC